MARRSRILGFHGLPPLPPLLALLALQSPAVALAQRPPVLPAPVDQDQSDLAARLRQASAPAGGTTEGVVPPGGAAPGAVVEGRDDHRLFSAEALAAYFPDRDRLKAEADAAEVALRGGGTPEALSRAGQAVRRFNEARRGALARMRLDAYGPEAIVVSGGTSLGAYEAGLL